MIEVEVDGQIIEFPDGMSADDISAAIRTMQAPQESQDVDMEAAVAEAAGISPVREAAGETLQYFKETAKNVPASVGRQFTNLYQAGKNVPAVLEGIGDLAIGGIEKGLRTATGSEAPLTEEEQALESVIEDFKGRYGGREEFLETLQQDPAGVALDVSALSGVAPKAARVNPVLATTEGVARPAGRVLKRAGRRVLEPVLKPKGNIVERRRVLKSALESGVKPSKAGLSRLDDLIEPLNAKVSAKLAEATKAGKVVQADDLYKVFDDLRAEYGPPKIDAVTDLKVINRMEKGWRDSLGGRTSITPEEAQRIKTDIYGKVVYGDLPRKEAIRSTVRKQAARRAKEEIADVVPDVAEANRQLERLLALKNITTARQRSIAQQSLWNPLREGSAAAAGAGLSFIHPALGATAALGIEAFTNPRFAPTTAQGLYRLGQGASAVGRAAGSPMVRQTLPPAQWMIDQALLADALREEREE